MDGWLDEQTDGQINRWIARLMDVQMYGWIIDGWMVRFMVGCLDYQVGSQTNGISGQVFWRMQGRIDGQLDKWMGEQSNEQIGEQIDGCGTTKMERKMAGQICGCLDRWSNWWMFRYIDGWMVQNSNCSTFK